MGASVAEHRPLTPNFVISQLLFSSPMKTDKEVGLFSLQKRRCWGDPTVAFQHLQENRGGTLSGSGMTEQGGIALN